MICIGSLATVVLCCCVASDDGLRSCKKPHEPRTTIHHESDAPDLHLGAGVAETRVQIVVFSARTYQSEPSRLLSGTGNPFLCQTHTVTL